jgi:hypothetical protein
MELNLPDLRTYKQSFNLAKIFGMKYYKGYNFVPEIDRIDGNGFSYYDFSNYYTDLS